MSDAKVLAFPGADRVTRGPCTKCGAPVERPGTVPRTRLRCDGCHGLHSATPASTLRYSDDPAAIAFVAAHPDGASHEEIGQFLGISRERVRQIQDQIFRSLGDRCAAVGIEAGTNPPVRRWRERPVEVEEEEAEVEEAEEAESAPMEDGGHSDLSRRIEALLDSICPDADFIEAITTRAAEIQQ